MPFLVLILKYITFFKNFNSKSYEIMYYNFEIKIRK